MTKVSKSVETYHQLREFSNKQNCCILDKFKSRHFYGNPINPWNRDCLVRHMAWRCHWTILLQISGRPKTVADFLWPKIEDFGMKSMWRKQNGATCYTVIAVIQLLHKNIQLPWYRMDWSVGGSILANKTHKHKNQCRCLELKKLKKKNISFCSLLSAIMWQKDCETINKCFSRLKVRYTHAQCGRYDKL